MSRYSGSLDASLLALEELEEVAVLKVVVVRRLLQLERVAVKDHPQLARHQRAHGVRLAVPVMSGRGAARLHAINIPGSE